MALAVVQTSAWARGAHPTELYVPQVWGRHDADIRVGTECPPYQTVAAYFVPGLLKYLKNSELESTTTTSLGVLKLAR